MMPIYWLMIFFYCLMTFYLILILLNSYFLILNFKLNKKLNYKKNNFYKMKWI
nr:ATP F0 synthase subunit 8 [Melipona bicolor]